MPWWELIGYGILRSSQCSVSQQLSNHWNPDAVLVNSKYSLNMFLSECLCVWVYSNTKERDSFNLIQASSGGTRCAFQHGCDWFSGLLVLVSYALSLLYVDHHIWTSSDFVFFRCIISFLPNRCLICGRALILLVFKSFHFSLMLPSFMWASCERIENSTFIASTGFLGVSVFLSSFGETCLFATQ